MAIAFPTLVSLNRLWRWFWCCFLARWFIYFAFVVYFSNHAWKQ